jgi:hypothetical protein
MLVAVLVSAWIRIAKRNDSQTEVMQRYGVAENVARHASSPVMIVK